MLIFYIAIQSQFISISYQNHQTFSSKRKKKSILIKKKSIVYRESPSSNKAIVALTHVSVYDKWITQKNYIDSFLVEVCKEEKKSHNVRIENNVLVYKKRVGFIQVMRWWWFIFGSIQCTTLLEWLESEWENDIICLNAIIDVTTTIKVFDKKVIISAM